MEPNTAVIVEDEFVVAVDLKMMLEEIGYQVAATFGSAEEALGQLGDAQPGFILMDIRLPGMDGIEAARLAREQHGVPVVFITAFDDDDYLCRAKELEPLGYLIKPVDVHRLKATLAIALHKNATMAEREEVEAKLREANSRMKRLADLVPICARCKSIRNDMGYWEEIEQYLAEHSEAQFTHGLCPSCKTVLYPDLDEPDQPDN